MASPEKKLPEEVPKWQLARQGIQLVINNKSNEAELLFKQYSNSIQMSAGYSYAVFMDALMTFEEDKLNLAFVVLKETERKCISDSSWIKSVKSKVFGSEAILSEAEYLENQIILADTQVCMAILTFLQQDFSGYFKGGWVLRKSWKLYQHAYNEIKNYYKDIFGELPNAAMQGGTSSRHKDDDDESGTTSDNSSEWEFPDDPFSLTHSSPSNGYIKNSHNYTPKMSHSYTTNCITEQHVHNDANLLKDSKCNSNISNSNGHDTATTSSIQNSSISSPSSINRFANSLLKKSTSMHSTFTNTNGKNGRSNGLLSHLPSFNSNLSLTYLSTTFNIFSLEKPRPPNINKETIARLMGAVSFGYGLFHLGISLLPPSLLRITNFLGFGGNRHSGIANLMYARKGTDMRAPLATLSLLWYHTIVRPFYALDGNNIQAGVKAATKLIEESEVEYAKSALFLFFKGRINRLNSDILGALKSFQAAVDNSTQREIKILSLHEVGWCHLLRLDYTAAESTFRILKTSSRWSRLFYAYLAIICSGSCNKIKDFGNLKEIKCSIENFSKGSQLEIFILRRFRYCPSTEEEMKRMDLRFWRLFVYELLYLWNALPSCSSEDIKFIIEECNLITNEPMLGLSKLIQGSCYCILRQYENGIVCFKKCLEIRKDAPFNADDAHISAFSQYELGVLLYRNEETKTEGRMLLSHTYRFKDYDFEQRLTVRIHHILKH